MSARQYKVVCTNGCDQWVGKHVESEASTKSQPGYCAKRTWKQKHKTIPASKAHMKLTYLYSHTHTEGQTFGALGSWKLILLIKCSCWNNITVHSSSSILHFPLPAFSLSMGSKTNYDFCKVEKPQWQLNATLVMDVSLAGWAGAGDEAYSWKWPQMKQFYPFLFGQFQTKAETSVSRATNNRYHFTFN